mmetsp:Transcript_40702/g.131806  ORF Transcript_40702/g.131806 Transcript_40702/m.131806 type:complete len:240 (+) Transcript_40702:605-1324(+)
MDARPPPPTSAATAPSSAASCANTAADSAATTGDTDAATLPLNLRTIWLTSATAAAISFASDARRRCGSAGCSAPSTSRANVSTIRCKRVTVFARTSPLEPRGPREARQSWIAAVNASRVPTCASDEKPFDTAAMTAMRCAASIALCSSASTALPSCRQSDGAAAAAAAAASALVRSSPTLDSSNVCASGTKRLCIAICCSLKQTLPVSLQTHTFSSSETWAKACSPVSSLWSFASASL